MIFSLRHFCWTLIFLPFGLVGQAEFSNQNDWKTQLALLGNTGLIQTPSGYLSTDRTLTFGGSYIPPEFSLIDFRTARGDKVFFANIAFLPFLETTVRLTKPVGSKNEFGIGDRSLFLRLQLLKEKQFLPAIVIGAHDPFGTELHRATYIAASKSFRVNGEWGILINAGYGHSFRTVENSYLNGPFAGLTTTWKFLAAVVEYDAESFNLGLKAMLFQGRFHANLSLLGMDDLAGGISYRFQFR